MTPQQAASHNAMVAQRIRMQIERQLIRGIGKGLRVAVPFLVGRVKEILSVPAPRRRVKSPIHGIYYVATTPATKGAPPRKLSGRLRAATSGEVISDTRAVIGNNVRSRPSPRYPGGFPYGRHHEIEDPSRPSSGQHRYIGPTLRQYKRELTILMGGPLRAELAAPSTP